MWILPRSSKNTTSESETADTLSPSNLFFSFTVASGHGRVFMPRSDLCNQQARVFQVTKLDLVGSLKTGLRLYVLSE